MMPERINNNIDTLSEIDLVKILFRINKVTNDTFQATVIENELLPNATAPVSSKDDPEGALYYVVVVLSVYAFAIVMFIASFVKKSGQDHGISVYMRDLEKVKRLEKRQEKFRFKLKLIHKDKKHRILGDSRALVETSSRTRRSSEGDAVDEQNLLLKPTSETPSVWSLVSLNLDDTLSTNSLSGQRDRRVVSSAPSSPSLPPVSIQSPFTPTPAPAPILPSPVSTYSNCIGTIPEVMIETCE